MKRILVACVAVGLGAGVVPAASPEVEAAIKAIEEVGADAGKLKLFCALNGILQSSGDNDDPAVEKQIADIIERIGPEFAAAWDLGDELDEDSADGMEFFAAIDTLVERCQ